MRKRQKKSNRVRIKKGRFSDPYSLNPGPDQAKTLNPDPDSSYFLTTLSIIKNNVTIIRFSYQKK